MSIDVSAKINQLLKKAPHNVVLTTAWLAEQGISSQLMAKYVKYDWFTCIAKSAYIRSEEKVTLEGGLFALQSQLGLSIHIGATTALSYQNISHFLKTNNEKILFGTRKETLPVWFEKYFSNFKIIKTEFLQKDVGIIDYNAGDNTIKISSVERAVLEVLYLCPDKASLKESYQLMEMLVNVRPGLMQELLEKCNSVKVKRLFLYMAEKINHDWLKYIETDKIDIGKGKRVVSKNGKLDKKYNIVIENLEEI
ncbi:MAG: type IV toxin-antitoxin system AbiEi family antitoxin domain-containing protein [bacterium]